MKEIVKAGYNRIANEYLKIRSDKSEDILLLQEVIDRLPKGAKVLDAGCGAGVPVTKILSQHFNVTGVDFAEAQIDLARRLVPEARFLCRDMTRLALPDQSFDAIISYYAIIHIPREEHRQLVLNFYRMLKPSGLILLCLGATDIERDEIEDYFGTKMYWSHFDADTNIELIKACGFNLISVKLVADATSPGSNHLFILASK
ncbi:MAG: class I SAM-dependent methyltransferase [Candidatus Helarchaeota archaeon]|nr:class I SAM-dependent methyltransferase [Candidatus Helarchaeota archaeon]